MKFLIQGLSTRLHGCEFVLDSSSVIFRRRNLVLLEIASLEILICQRFQKLEWIEIILVAVGISSATMHGSIEYINETAEWLKQ
mmetsp:Transcript_1006/g.4104  ORF Transcript_1006/g.4104 Transcript_1006/m.4104 type:complete len:84 (+) Transcript_1006:1205-1456(+)